MAYIETVNWKGNIFIASFVSSEGIDISFRFDEDPEKKANKQIILSNGATIDVVLIIQYLENYDIPVLSELRLNGNNICDRTLALEEQTYNTDKYLNGLAEPQMLGTTLISPLPTIIQSNSQQKVDTCGIIIPKPSPLIFKGQLTYYGQFPWHVAIFLIEDNEETYSCGGSIISSNLVLSVSHCVTILATSQTIDPKNLIVYAGKNNLKNLNQHERKFNVSQVLNHPYYDYETFKYDVALVKLSTQTQFNSFIRPICLWNKDNNIRKLVNQLGTVPGWGFTSEKGVTAADLTFINMPIVNIETCLYSNPDFFARVTNDRTFCAGFLNGSTVCNGDSGGGMVFQYKNQWFLRGIVSLSLAHQDFEICDSRHYVVFTDIVKYIPWIRDNIARLK